MKISASWRWTRSAFGLARNKWLNLLHEAKKKGGSLYPTFLWRKTMLLFDDDSVTDVTFFPWRPIQMKCSKLQLKKTKQKKKKERRRNEAVYHLRLSTHLIPGGRWQILSSYPTIHNSDSLPLPLKSSHHRHGAAQLLAANVHLPISRQNKA